MQKTVIRLVCIGTCVASLSAVGGAQQAPRATGHWEGKIQMGNRDLGLTLDLARRPTGKWIGSVSIPPSTAIDVPLTTITVEDTTVRFTASLPGRTSFEGVLSGDANSLSGTVSNVQGAVPFQLARAGEANVKVPPPSSALSKEFEGTWDGYLDVGGKAIHIALKLSPAPDGTAMATLITVDQGNQEIPITTVTLQNKQVHLEARAVSGTYDGTLGASGEIAGEWTQGPSRLPLTFKHASPATTPH